MFFKLWARGGISSLTNSVHLFHFLFRKLIKNYHRFSSPHESSPRAFSSPTQKSVYTDFLVGEGGLEPPILTELVPKTSVSTNCTTRPSIPICITKVSYMSCKKGRLTHGGPFGYLLHRDNVIAVARLQFLEGKHHHLQHDHEEDG